MENCKEIFALLSQYLDRELPPDVCQEIESHLAACPPCIQFVDSLRTTIRLSRKYRPEDAPNPIGEEAKERLLEAYRKCRQAAPSPDNPGPLK